jgi:hypothetical protein
MRRLSLLPIAVGASACLFSDLDGLQGGDPGGTAVSASSTAASTAAPSTTTGPGTGGDGGVGGVGGDGGALATGGGGGEGGAACVPPSYPEVVADSLPIAYFRLEETEGSEVLPAIGDYVGTYREATTAPGEGGPVELGVPGIVAEGLATRLPATTGDRAEGGLALAVDPVVLMGTNFAGHDFSIELWFDAEPSFRGTFLFQPVSVNEVYGVRLLVAQPEGPEPTTVVSAEIHPADAASEAVRGVAPSGLERLHVVLAVDAHDDGTDDCTRVDAALYLGGSLVGDVEGICSPAPIAPFTTPMELPGDQLRANESFVVDEIALYDRVLSPDEVAAHHRAGLGECDE